MNYEALVERQPGRVWGSERKTGSGYIVVYMPGHPRANAIGEVPKHTLVLEATLGRYLAPNEVAHHINHRRDDNRPENLRLMDEKEHKWMHIWEAIKKRKRQLAKQPKKVKPPKPPNPNAPKPWTPEENDRLRAGWLLDDKTLAEQLGRTKAAVQGHRMRLGLGCKPGKRGSPWLDQQERYIRDIWGRQTIPEMAEFLGRTVTAVSIKAKRLGLRGQVRTGEMITANAAAEILGVDGHAVCDYWMLKCGLNGWTLTRGNGERTVTVIYRTDLRRWLKEHPELWDSRRLAPGALWKKEPKWLQAKREADAQLPPRRFAKWTPEEDAKLLALLEQGGLSYRQLGNAMGRSDRSIIQRVRRIGAGGLRQWKKEARHDTRGSH